VINMEKIAKWLTLVLTIVLIVGGSLLAFHEDVFGAYYKIPLATTYMGAYEPEGSESETPMNMGVSTNVTIGMKDDGKDSKMDDPHPCIYPCGGRVPTRVP
jgi:hypothetical protein